MNHYTFVVNVECFSEEEAVHVMNERICYDEDYGFDYKIDWDFI